MGIDEESIKQASIDYAKERAKQFAIENPIKGRSRSKKDVASSSFRDGARWMIKQLVNKRN